MSKHFPPSLLTDFYKISHIAQYPEATSTVYSTWIARESLIGGIDHVVAFGVQSVIQRYFVDYFNEHFFRRALDEVLEEYTRIIRNTLGIESPATAHLEALWSLGYLPLEIRALPEGTLTPLRVPMVTAVNTLDEFYWLTNFVETLFSAESWILTTSATVAFEYRKLFDRYARETGGDLTAVPFQGHDFSFRGMSSIEAAAASGAAHLLSFYGTDTIPAILFHEYYYGANSDTEMVGASIPATEHSVMCAYGNEGPDDEFNSFAHIVTDLYPDGFVSVVSDTWDLWRVIGEYLPLLKDRIMARDGRVVIRPDSGDPVDIVTGSGLGDGSLADLGVVESLWNVFHGTINEQGYKVLDPHIGVIYGDAISLSSATRILTRLKDKGFASTNIVFGVGSFSYQHTNRDTFGHAFKSTSVTVRGVEKAIFKDPVTDANHMKRSLRGRVAVVDTESGLEVVDGLMSHEELEGDLLQVVFRDGAVANIQTLAQIRARLLSRLA
ncbi:MAG: nicotinate phosphoribosyltransferase [Acidimicrobiales bacterium]